MFDRSKLESLRDVSVTRIGDTFSYGFPQTVLHLTTLRLRSFTYRSFLDKHRRCLGSLGLPAELYATHSFQG